MYRREKKLKDGWYHHTFDSPKPMKSSLVLSPIGTVKSS